jgi:hypothetical protein
MSQRPDLTHRQVRDLILGNVDATPETAGKVASGGRLNAKKALAAAIALPINSTHGIARSGDFNGDGKDDVLLRHKSGSWFVYPMNGKTFIAGQHGFANLTSNLDWQFAQIGDQNGDGKDDVLLRHTSGSWFYYPMNGKTFIAGQHGFANITSNLDWRLP